MKEIHLDCSKITDKASFHDEISAALSFPDYYGRNLDALYDCLAELSDRHLVLEHFSSLENTLGDYASSIKQVLQEAENDCLSLCITFR